MIKLNDNYEQQPFLELLRELLPDFEKDVRKIDVSEFKVFENGFSLGKSKLLDLQVFEVKHQSSNTARVAIATDGFRLMKQSAVYKALVVFRSDNSEDWRLSLMTMTPERNEKGGVSVQVSNPRRYSYLLGQNAKINTPTKFLISKGKIQDFDDLKNRFSIEVVNKEFYNEISKAFTGLVSGKLKLPDRSDLSRTSLEFAVRMIGRIIFCWFLREKVSDTGLALMPKDLLSLDAIANNKDYYHKVLEPIFFEVLNKPSRSRNSDFTSSPFSTIPYLNGGLFSPQDDDFYKRTKDDYQSQFHNTLVIPDEWFVDFFKILETYNFTIDENTSYDEELSIDPEMLGRIFENLLAEINPETGESARKSTGSYYTPRVIVNYMVDESLLLYLKNKTGINEAKLKAIISYDLSDDAETPSTEEEKEKIIDALEKVKILDPACGSGAFPIGALQKIVFILQQTDPDGELWFKKQIGNATPELRRDIEKRFSNNERDFIRKLGVIRNSIFGIDIQPIATEIARLRCFLTLIVEEEVKDNEDNRGIRPLPNLDFKFVTANSLIGLPDVDTSQQSIFDDYKKIDELKHIRDDYFNASGIEREQLKTEFSDKQNDLINEMIDKHDYAGYAKAELTRKLTSWRPFKHSSSDWFDPEWMFGIKDGFDIVIANPPYLGEKGNKDVFRNIKNSPLGIRFHLGKMDLFYFFLHFGIDLLNRDGVLTFITTNYYVTASGAKKLINDLKKRTSILKLVNFNELKIFESALGQHNMITILQNGNRDIQANTVITSRKGYLHNSDEILKNILYSNDSETQYRDVSQKDLYDGDIIRLSGNDVNTNTYQSVFNKMLSKSVLLDDICKINLGCHITISKITNKVIEKFNGFKKDQGVFVLNKSEVDSLGLNDAENVKIKSFIKNSDIYKYSVKPSNEKLIYTRWDDNIELYPNIKRHLLKFKSILDDQGKRYGESSWPWFSIHRPREVELFETKEKILVPYRSKQNIFGYYDKPIYASGDVFFIILRKHINYSGYSIKLLLGILNSKLIYQWLYRRGKRKGEMLELYQDPLSKIPIPIIDTEYKKELVVSIENLVNKIIILKNETLLVDVSDLDNQIEKLVYSLYELSEEEIDIVEHAYS